MNTLQECLRTVLPSQAAAFTAAYGNGGTTNTIPQGTASQLSQLQGGNLTLKPEEADTLQHRRVAHAPALDGDSRRASTIGKSRSTTIIDTLPAGVILNGLPRHR